MADPILPSQQQQQQQQQQVRPAVVDAQSTELVRIVRGATNNFTNWLTRHGCDVKGASRRTVLMSIAFPCSTRIASAIYSSAMAGAQHSIRPPVALSANGRRSRLRSYDRKRPARRSAWAA